MDFKLTLDPKGMADDKCNAITIFFCMRYKYFHVTTSS